MLQLELLCLAARRKATVPQIAGAIFRQSPVLTSLAGRGAADFRHHVLRPARSGSGEAARAIENLPN